MSSIAAVLRTDLVGSLGSPGAYVERVLKIPVLTREEETELAHRLRRDADIEAARQLVFSHLRFVVYIARRYQGYGLPLSDLIQEGNVGLMKAVKRFDPSMGARLVTFAIYWIRAEIHEYVYRNWRLVRVVSTKAQRKLFFRLRRAKKRLGWMSSEERRAVANDLQVTPQEVMEMEQRLIAHDVSFDPVPDASDETSTNPSAYLASPMAGPLDVLAEEQQCKQSRAQLETALDSLDERSRTVVRRRWLATEKATLHELADQYHVSAERIRQIEANALKALGRILKTDADEDGTVRRRRRAQSRAVPAAAA